MALLPGVDIISKGPLNWFTPLWVFSWVPPKFWGMLALVKSVNVTPRDALGTVWMFATVPTFSIKSVLVAKSYTLAKSVGRMYSKETLTFKVVELGRSKELDQELWVKV